MLCSLLKLFDVCDCTVDVFANLLNVFGKSAGSVFDLEGPDALGEDFVHFFESFAFGFGKEEEDVDEGRCVEDAEDDECLRYVSLLVIHFPSTRLDRYSPATGCFQRLRE